MFRISRLSRQIPLVSRAAPQLISARTALSTAPAFGIIGRTRLYSTAPDPANLARQRAAALAAARRAAEDKRRQDNLSTGLYAASVLVAFIALSYAAVPAYQIFCSATGYAGTPKSHPSGAEAESALSTIKPLVGARPIRVTFTASTSSNLNWKFTPQQREMFVLPGETALAFYTAKNLSDEDIIGVATYNVTPLTVGPYFNKVQCFCFEEQMLAAGEEIDMPIFFYLDPAMVTDDYNTVDVDAIMLSYCFFKSKDNSAVSLLRPNTIPSVTKASVAQ
ncbi:hypothetical protein GQ42DRAFT_162234 [Ramicandelaber brevisporus]|nr:hypothetical protein GQ42DRAFT_162234 [Ramicandelaber brevisporus]